MKLVWESGMADAFPEPFLDAATCLFGYCFNGLRESSVCLLQTQDGGFEEEQSTCRFHVVKGQRERSVPLVRFSVREDLSPPGLCRILSNMRPDCTRSLALAQDQVR